MVESVIERVRRHFSGRLERYRALVRESVASGGKLSAAKVDEVLAIAAELGLPADRFSRDESAVIAERNLVERMDAIREANGQTSVDVPLLEAEVAALSAEFVQAKRQWELRRDELEREVQSRRNAIAAEQHRPRQSTANLETQLRRVHDYNPVMFRSGVTAEELPNLLEVRQTLFGGD